MRRLGGGDERAAAASQPRKPPAQKARKPPAQKAPPPCAHCRASDGSLWVCPLAGCGRAVWSPQHHLNYDHHMKLIATLPAWLELHPFRRTQCPKCRRPDRALP
jgi:hypothetical protein